MNKTTRRPNNVEIVTLKEFHRPDIMVYRVGNFYECFGEDAELVNDCVHNRTQDQIDRHEVKTLADGMANVGFSTEYFFDLAVPYLLNAGHTLIICEITDEVKVDRVSQRARDYRVPWYANGAEVAHLLVLDNMSFKFDGQRNAILFTATDSYRTRLLREGREKYGDDFRPLIEDM